MNTLKVHVRGSDLDDYEFPDHLQSAPAMGEYVLGRPANYGSNVIAREFRITKITHTPDCLYLTVEDQTSA